MKRLAAVCLFTSSLIFAESSTTDLAGLNEMQRFYYEQGYQDSRIKSYEEGYKRAKDEFVNQILPRYANRIKAYEAGKYLIEEGKITYPKVFRYKGKDGYSVHIEAPIVEKAFDEKDLYMLPEIAMSKCESQANGSLGGSAGEDVDYTQNAFSLPQRDDVTLSRDGAPEVRKEKVVVHLPYKNEGLVQALDSYNIPYSSTKDGYDLYFSNDAEKDDFCVKVTGNAKCTL